MSSAGDFSDIADAPHPSDSLLNSSRKGVKVGLPRQKAFDMPECIAVTRAALIAKNDPLRGAESKFEDFLSRFMLKFNDYKRKEFPDRSVLSLYEKFKEIRHDCHQFTGIVAKIQTDERGKPQSGTTQSEEADIAKVPIFIH